MFSPLLHSETNAEVDAQKFEIMGCDRVPEIKEMQFNVLSIIVIVSS